MDSVSEVHTGYIRTIRGFGMNSNNFLTGSFDKTVKLFDVRTEEKLQGTFEHLDEVQDLRLYEDDTKFISVSGKKVSINFLFFFALRK